MVRSVVERHLHVHDVVAGEHARLHRALDTRVDRRNEFLRNDAAGDGVDELVTLAGLVGFDLDLDVTVLTFTAGLTRVLGLLIDGFPDGLLVGDLRVADVCLDLEFAKQTVNDDLEVEFAHPGDDRLTRFLVGVGAEGRILLCELGEGDAHLFLTRFGLGLDGDADNRLREDHRFKDDRVLLVAERVARGGGFHADDRRDVARVDGVDIGSVVCVHHQDPPETLVLVLGRVVDLAALGQGAGVNPEEAKFSDVGVGHDLERECRERFVVPGVTLVLLLGLGVDALDRGDVERRGEIIHDGVEQFLHALVLVGRTAADRDDLVVDRRLAERGFQLVDRDLVAVAELLEKFLVGFRDTLDHLVVVFLREIRHIGGDRLNAHILSEVVVVHVGFHRHQINDPAEGSFLPDREHDRHGVGVQTLNHHTDDAVEVGAGDVHLVDVRHPGDLVLVRLPPDGLGLGFDASLGAEDGNGTVQHAKRTLDFNGEVNVTGGVDDVDSVGVFLGRNGIVVVTGRRPVTGGRGGGDGDPTLLLLNHPVHGRAAVVRLTDPMDASRVEQDTLGGGRFPGVNVRHDPDIAGMGKRIFSRHSELLLRDANQNL